MHIKKLNFEARDREFTVTTEEPSVQVVIGANGTGKTTLLNAVSMVCPINARDRGPMPGEAFALRASFDADPPLDIARKVTPKGGHKIQVGRDRKATPTASIAAIHERLGSASVWSMADLMALSPDKALAWLEQQVVDALVVDLDKQIAPHRERLAEFLQKTIGDGGSTLDNIVADGETFNRDKLVAVITELQERWRLANSQVREVNALIERYEKDRESADLPSGTVETWRSERDTAQAEVERLSRTMGESTGLAVTRNRLEADIAAKAEQYEETTEQDPETIRAEHQPTVDAAEAVYQDTTAALDTAREESAAATTALNLAERNQARASGVLETLGTETVAALVPYDEGETCERCGSEVTNETAERVAQIVDAHERKRDEAIDALEAAKRATEAASECAAAASKAVGRAEKIHATAGRNLHAAQMAMTTALGEAAWAMEKRIELAAELSTMRGQLVDLGNPPDVSTVRAQLTALTEQLAVAESNADQLQDWQGRRADSTRHLEELEAAEEDRTEARELINELGSKGVLGNVLRSGLVPLVDVASQYVQQVIGHTLWVDGEGGFQWGLVHGSTRIPCSAMSNSELAVSVVFLGIVIKAKLGGWRCVVLDDCENLDTINHEGEADSRRDRFVATLNQAIQVGHLDEAWLGCVDDGWTPRSSAKITRL